MTKSDLLALVVIFIVAGDGEMEPPRNVLETLMRNMNGRNMNETSTLVLVSGPMEVLNKDIAWYQGRTSGWETKTFNTRAFLCKVKGCLHGGRRR